MFVKNVWRALSFVTAIVLLLANFVPAMASQPHDVWPDSLVGEWKGTIGNKYGTTDVDTTITRGSDGALTDVATFAQGLKGPSRFVQEVYKEITTLDGQNNYYYCFRWDGTDVYVVEDCYRVIDNNHVYLLYFGGKFGIEGASGGVLTRVGEPIISSTTQDGVMGCEPANGKTQYGIINIGPDVFVILCGIRWLVPNPVTLDALGINRNMIDNMGMSDAELTAIPKSTVDIPDIDRDPVGFQNFLNEHGQELENMNVHFQGQNVPSQLATTPVPLVEVPIETPEEPFFCNWWIIGWLACDLAEANSANARCEPQCMTEMRKDKYRPDMNQWSKGTGSSSPNDVLSNAMKMQVYTDPKTGEKLQVRVRESGESPKVGDLIIWPNDCGGANKSTGHIGEVKTVVSVIVIDVHDSNWDNTCEEKNRQIQILSCMRFVTTPFQAGTYIPAVQTPVTSCDQYQGWQNFACQYIPWWKP